MMRDRDETARGDATGALEPPVGLPDRIHDLQQSEPLALLGLGASLRARHHLAAEESSMTDADRPTDAKKGSTHSTKEERPRAGREARATVGRAELGLYELGAQRRDPVEILLEQENGRQPDLLPIRHGRMAASPFAFLRGAAAVMTAELAPSPVTGMTVQAIGDAHISNFGVFATPERRLVFDVNDFDETLRAPWEWDVKRLVASVVVASRENGAKRSAAAGRAREAARAHRMAMRRFADQSTLDVWYAHLHVADLVRREHSKRSRSRNEEALANIRRRTSEQVAGKLTERVDGALRFKSVRPLLTPLRELVQDAEAKQIRDRALRSLLGYRKTSLRSGRSCSTATASWTWRARSSASAASAPAAPSPLRRSGRRRCLDSAIQGGQPVRARALCGAQPLPAVWRARRQRAADRAGG
jgi:hypothetical protein